jgi:hypothetical protein
MLRFFRLNDPYRLLFVFIAVIVLGLKTEFENSEITLPEFNGVLVGEMMGDGKSMYTEVWHSMPPMAAFVQYLHDVAFDRSFLARHITALVFLFIQAALFGIMLINNRAFNESNYLPSFIMAIISFFSFDTVSITGEIVGATLLLLAMNNLLKEIEFKRPSDETIHNLGFYLGLASLSVFSYIVFFVGVGVLLFIFTRVEYRRFGLYLIGFLFPHLIINMWYYWNDNINLLWSNFYVANFNFSSQSLIDLKSLLILSFLPVSYFLFSLIMMRRDARLTKYQSQIAQIMFLWLILGLIEIYLNPMRTPQALLVCAPPFVYYISHYFLLIKRKWIAEIMAWIFLIGILGIESITSRKLIPAVDFKPLYVAELKNSYPEEKKVLVLNDDLSPYINNTTSSYFLDWKLSQDIFLQPDIYQHVLLVARSFEVDPPEIIIDPENNFGKILKYLPELRVKYKRRGENYVRFSSSSGKIFIEGIQAQN